MKFTSHDSPLTTHRASALRSAGFTVVELAVVLVVIGLIFVGVLKLEQVYRNYKIRQVVNQYRELSVAVKVYRDKYGYWPGDDPRANVHVGVAYNGDGDDRVANNLANPGNIGGYSYQQEYSLANEHLSSAGLISGACEGRTNRSTWYPVTPIRHAFNGYVYIFNQWYTSPTANVAVTSIRFDGLPPDVAQAVDTSLDDGNPSNGVVRAYTINTPTNWQPVATNYTGTANVSIICDISN